MSPFFVTCALATISLGVHAEPVEPRVAEVARSRILTVRFRVEPESGGQPGACATLDPRDLSVRLRGKPVEASRIVSLARDVRPMLHALVIDRSGSMEDKLEAVREAARGYVERLRPGLDRGLVVVFDDDVLLAARATSDPATLTRAVDEVVVGGATALYDALETVIGELSIWLERPVVILLSDGADTSSVATQDDVFGRADERPDLAVFPIGLALPEIGQSGPGPITPKKFLQLLARRTDGVFLDVPTPAGVARAYDRVRDLLDAEWEVVIADPEPSAEPAEPEVRVTGRPCRRRILGRRDADREGDERAVRAAPEADELPECVSEPRSIPRSGLRLGPRLGSRWRSETGTSGVAGCVVDLTMDEGLLYDDADAGGRRYSAWREIGVRPFEIRAGPPGALPGHPAAALDVIARDLATWNGEPPEPGPYQERLERHARPFRDLPFVWNGRTVLAVRDRLASALAELPDYAAHAGERTAAEARAALDERAERLARTARDLSPERVLKALVDTPEGRAILERGASPGPRDRARHLAAWLGDVPVADLFREWERGAIALLLAREADPGPSFDERYRAAHRLFFTPSYARVLAPLVVGRDPASGAIGFWRFVLPRASWIEPRKESFDDVENRRIPMDLVPDRALGYRLAGEIVRTTEIRLVPIALTYESLEPPRKLDPWRAFDRARVTLRLAGEDGREITAVAEFDRDGAPRKLEVQESSQRPMR